MDDRPRKPNLSAKYSLEMGFSFHTHLGDNLSIWKRAVLNQDIDCAGVIDGKEGAGKSVLGMQIAAFLDVDHHLDPATQLCWTPDAFKKAVGSLPKGKAIVWDEARRGLNRRRSAQDVNLSITDMLAECRQHNLFLIIIMPSFYDMDMNVAVWRTRFLIHVDYHWDLANEQNPLVRGDFIFYNERGKLNLYTDKELRKRYAYPYIPNDSFNGTFINHYVVDEKAYKEMKKQSDLAYNSVAVNADTPERKELQRIERGRVLSILSSGKFLKIGAIPFLCDRLGVSKQTPRNWMEEYEEQERKRNSFSTEPPSQEATS